MSCDCGCCTGVEVLTPVKMINRPGLGALSYRVGTHGSFLESMKARLSSMTIEIPADDTTEAQTLRPLMGLTTRKQDDASIALLDAWATVADVLTFYQERIANEGYLRTAVERRSVLELARLVGYAPRPGVAASVFLAFTLENSYKVEIPEGARVQSLPGPGELPQSFETSEKLEARSEWNNLTPQMSAPQIIKQSTDFKTIDADAIYLQGTATNLKPNDPLLFVFGDGANQQMLLHVKTVEPDNAAQITKVTLNEPPTPAQTTGGVGGGSSTGFTTGVSTGGSSLGQQTVPTDALSALDALLPSISKPASIQPANSQALGRSVASTFASAQDTGPQLIAAFRPNIAQTIYKALGAAAVTSSSQLKVYAPRLTAPLFGNNAPFHITSITNGTVNSNEWTAFDVQAAEETTVVYLDAAYDGILPDSWVVVDTSAVTSQATSDFPKHPPLLFAKAGNPKAGGGRAAYSITGKTTRIELEKPDDTSKKLAWIGFNIESDGVGVTAFTESESDFDEFEIIRRTLVYAKSEELTLAQAPVTKDICEDRIALGAVYDGLRSGRWVIITGDRADLPLGTEGIKTAELVMLSGVEQGFDPSIPGDKAHTTLTLANKPAYCYKRDTVKIYGNVVESTHGETRNEVLGSGDGSKSLQKFALRQTPLTYLAAPTAAGAESTLHTTVNDIEWHETDSLAALGPTDRKFVTQTDDSVKTTVIFGNGKQGVRPPTGNENVKAVYRTGIGKPGNVKAEQISLLVTKPLGVKGVINPIRASGGADRESRDQARRNVPLAVMALDRLVSVQDYQDFARTFAGIGKASSVQLSNGLAQVVHLTIAGADDIPIDENSSLFRNLLKALRNAGDPDQQFLIKTRELMLLVISAKVRLLPDYQWEIVEAAIRASLLDTFGFEKRDLGQSVFLGEVIGAIQKIPGVAYVDVDTLDSISESDASDSARLTKKLKDLADSASKSGSKPKNAVFVRLAEQQTVAGCSSTTATSNICPAQLAILSPDVTDTLILTELKA